jgi:hypothetical protein
MVVLGIYQLSRDAGAAAVFYQFMSVSYAVMFSIILTKHSSEEYLYILFNAIFALETLCICIEVIDSLLGFDIHASALFASIMNSDPDRFSHMMDYDDIPIALGLHGFPHYTAPIYVVSFAFALTHSFKDKLAHYRQFFTLIVGVGCIYALGVKTHFVSTAVVLLMMSILVSRKIITYSSIALFACAVITLSFDGATDRMLGYVDQIAVGNAHEGTRMELIFNAGEYLIFNELSLPEIFFGLGDWSALAPFIATTYFFEQKILAFAVVFGLAYIAIVGSFAIKALIDSYRIRKDAYVGVAIFCAILVYMIDALHYAFSLFSPMIQLFFLMIAALIQLTKRNRHSAFKFR